MGTFAAVRVLADNDFITGNALFDVPGAILNGTVHVSKSYKLVTFAARLSSTAQEWHNKCYLCFGMNLPPIEVTSIRKVGLAIVFPTGWKVTRSFP
jgi:hypothetical protein